MDDIRRFVVGGIAFFLVGCPGFGSDTARDGLPEQPTYSENVAAILQTNCASACHSVPPQNGAPDYMRLDQYEDSNGGTISGAGSLCCLIKFRAVDLTPSPMPPPPRPTLSIDDTEIVRRWTLQGCRNFPAEPIGTPCP